MRAPNLVFHPFLRIHRVAVLWNVTLQKVATIEQNLISAIAGATKAVQNNRVKKEIHTQSITGLSVLCSHTVFSYSPVLLVSKKPNTPGQRKRSKTPR